MLPTPSTSHVPYERVYEPAEDSFLLLDTLSSPSETAFLSQRFSTAPAPTPSPLILEIGPGSGVVLAFVTAHSQTLFSRRDVLTLGIDINRFACVATAQTVTKAVAEAAAEAGDPAISTTDPVPSGNSDTPGSSSSSNGSGTGYFLATAQGDLTSAVRPGQVDVLVFNPPYVPTAELPSLPNQLGADNSGDDVTGERQKKKTTYEEDSVLLALSYAGGKDGMEITDRVIAELPGVLSARGVAYLLLCAQNKPEEVKGRIREMEGGGVWRAETVGTSGRQAGWEKLQIVRIWRE